MTSKVVDAASCNWLDGEIGAPGQTGRVVRGDQLSLFLSL